MLGERDWEAGWHGKETKGIKQSHRCSPQCGEQQSGGGEGDAENGKGEKR